MAEAEKLRIECVSCDEIFILIYKQTTVKDICCPFCTAPITLAEEE